MGYRAIVLYKEHIVQLGEPQGYSMRLAKKDGSPQKKCCTKTPDEMFLKRPKAEPEIFFPDEASLLTKRLLTRIFPTNSSSGSGCG